MERQDQHYLEVKDLIVAFRTDNGTQVVVNRVSFNLDRGEVLGLVGESACGKSITALSVLRLLPPGGSIAGGEVLLQGVNLRQLSGEKMRRTRGKKIAMIFQDPNTTLNPVRTVGAQFVETLRSHRALSRGEARARAGDMLSALGLADPVGILGKFPFQLSGGMRQRVMIALALALEPDILIADEPTTALDVTVQAQILAEMRRLKEGFGTGILLISHNMGVIAQLSDRVAVMYAGSIVESGMARDVFYRPAHPYTRALLNSIPDLCRNDQTLCSIPGQPPAPGRMPGGCPFLPRCGRAGTRCSKGRPTRLDMGSRHWAACFYPLLEGSCCEGPREKVTG